MKQFLEMVRLVKAAKLWRLSQEIVADVISEEDHLSPRYTYEMSLYQSIRSLGLQTGRFLYFEREWYFFAMWILEETLCDILDTALTLAAPYMGPRTDPSKVGGSPEARGFTTPFFFSKLPGGP
jgi:hypothetical protein